MVHPHDLYSPFEPWTVRIRKIAKEFVNSGHQVILVYFPLEVKNANRQFIDDGIEILALSRRFGLLTLIKNIIQMVRLARDCDVVHFQKCHYYSALPALIAAWVRNKPAHYDWDDWETKIFYYSNPREFAVGEFMHIYEKFIPKMVDTVSVSSNNLRKLCLTLGVPPGNIFSAPVGADLEKFNPGAVENSRGKIKARYGIKNYLVTYIGQLHGGQYAELFVKAASLIPKKNFDITFMIVGDGYRLAELKRLARGMGIADNFIFTGYVPHSDIPQYLADTDISVACFEDNEITRSKSPLKIVEYLACGRTIVASNVGEVRYMVGGVGILVKPGDAASLAGGIMLALSNEKMRAALGKGAIERSVRKYNWRVTANNILEAYRLVTR